MDNFICEYGELIHSENIFEVVQAYDIVMILLHMGKKF